MNDIDEISRLAASVTGKIPESIKEIKGSGSTRKYFRLDTEPSLIATVGNDLAENDAFFYLTDEFWKKGLAVPQLVAVSNDRRVYLQSDDGNRSLFDCLDRDDLICKALESLVRIQYCGGENLDYSRCYPVASMDGQAIMWDLNYFKYCFLKNTPLEFSEAKLERDFVKLAGDLAVKDDVRTFMMRDFQSRNVIVNNDDKVTLIDYQGGRRGPVEYDIASFAWQARAGFSPEKRDMIADFYFDLKKKFDGDSREKYLENLKKYLFLRQLQTLGAYGYRGLGQQKAHFVKSIPQTLLNLKETECVAANYPYLAGVLKEVVEVMMPKFETADSLTVKVGSFSYKQGIPADFSGNGGGFIFDCRGLPNPGRYPEYKALTGRDLPVIEYLEQFKEIDDFIKAAEVAVDISVKTYKERGFNSLMVNFGCTGGQHRSVYCAERIARHIHRKFGVKVILAHRERNILEILSQA